MKEVSERLVRRGHDVTVLATGGSDASGGGPTRLAEVEVINGVNVQRFSEGSRFQYGLSRLLSLSGAHRVPGLGPRSDAVRMLTVGPCTLRPLYACVQAKWDVVAVSNWYCSSLAYQVSQARRFREFAFVGIPLFHTESDWSQSSLHGRTLNRCDTVIALTEHERRFIAQRSVHSDVHVVGVGIDPRAFVDAAGDEVRTRYGLGDAPVVGYVGRMTAAKGVMALIEALKMVWKTDPTVRLLLAGSSPQDELAGALAALSPFERSRVITTGPLSDGEKGSVFDALDLFAMPSVGESFGIAYLEAWSRKKPVIGSRIGSTQCVIEDGVDGVLVNPGSAGELAGAIVRLLADRSTRERMGKLGYEKTMNRFTWDQITNQIEHIYHQANRQTLKPRPAISVEEPSPGKSSRSRWA
jgi:glycosyltransferase involved in cell wall biosynthesis